MTAAVAADEPQPTPPGTALVAVPAQRATLTDKVTYARELAESGLLPAAFRQKPANVLYAVEYGDMIGIAPMAAITGIHVIEGKPSASSALMSALVRRAGHRLRIKGDDAQATVQIVRSDDPSFTFESVWTLARAKTAGLLGKDVWKKYPAAMLKARAISECARDACEEALLGLHYTAEELGADVDEEGNPIRATIEHANVTPLVPRRDWQAEITAAERALDRERLRKLYNDAPAELKPTIGEAGKRVTAALAAQNPPPATPATSAAPQAPADEVVDAEIVEPAPAPVDLNREAVALVDALLILADQGAVSEVVDADIRDKPVGDVDVSGVLTQDDREVLGVEPGRLTLMELARKVYSYTAKHQRSVRDPFDLGGQQ